MSLAARLRSLFARNQRLRRFVVNLVAPAGDRMIELFHTRLTIDGRADFTYLRAHRQASDSYVLRDDSAAILTLAALLEHGDTVVDVGANIGLYAATLARVGCRLGLAIYAIEANPETAIRLRRNVEHLGVHVFGVAASDRSGSVEFRDTGSSLTFATAGATRSRSVAVTAARLDELPIQGSQIVLKIDVEGHDPQVLQGASRWFDDNRVKAVLIDGFDESNPSLPAGFVVLDAYTQEPAASPYTALLVRT